MENKIEEEIKNLTTQLLDLVNHYCWNDISKNLMFILSDISEVKGENFFIQRLNKNKLNKNKILKSFNEAMAAVKEIYHLTYDINLYVYKSEKHQTIIDIRYFLKSQLDADYLKKVINNPPMLHCKITQPPYLKSDKNKFDVNWELGGLKHNWNMFWWKLNYKLHKCLAPIVQSNKN
ncbi:hypothetical protein [Flavobacterium sp. Root186]|uniref:hypothetical protein n=1 Tax=Flavobacterium sp. Root186 TaxID=1736485 RepID=UPI0006F671C7|nr:hypothetical protein [Flavobacterium sp. Root186]KRB56932.1 hypothetical protein ASD98_09650 [Flavobacterium sp. Root186]